MAFLAKVFPNTPPPDRDIKQALAQAELPKAEPANPIKTLDEAIRRVQGISNESVRFGVEYMQEHAEGATAALIKALEIQKKTALERGDYWDCYRFRRLAEALFIQAHAEVKAYAMKQVDEFLAFDWQEADLKNLDTQPGKRATVLEIFLKACLPQAEVNLKLRDRLYDSYEKLKSAGQAEAVFALLRSGTAKDEDFQPMLKSATGKNNLAVAYWWLSKMDYPDFMQNKTLERMKKAEQYATDVDLLSRIRKDRLEFLKKHAERSGVKQEGITNEK